MAKYKIYFYVSSEQKGVEKELDYYLNKYIEHALPPKCDYNVGYVYVDEVDTD